MRLLKSVTLPFRANMTPISATKRACKTVYEKTVTKHRPSCRTS